MVKNEYLFNSKILKGVILNRGLEMESRTKSNNVIWNVESPDILRYERDASSSSSSSSLSTVEVVVVQRKVEMPVTKDLVLMNCTVLHLLRVGYLAKIKCNELYG